MTHDDIPEKLRAAFLLGSSSQSPDASLRRPPVPQRTEADYKGDVMVRYIGGLQSRLVAHIERHAARWHAQEAHRILRRWVVPTADHPAPSWADQRDAVREARDYAASLLQERLVARLLRVHDLRVEYGLDLRMDASRLNRIFNNASPDLRKDFKHKM